MYITNPILDEGQNIFKADDLTVELGTNVGKQFSSIDDRYTAYTERTGISSDWEKTGFKMILEGINASNSVVAAQAQNRGETLNYTEYKIEDFGFEDHIFYVPAEDVFTGGVIDADEANARAQMLIEASIKEKSDYIKVTNSNGEESYIKPETNFALLTYDLEGIVGTTAQQEAYKNGEELKWYEKIFKWISDAIETVIEWVKTTWDKFIAWITGANTEGPTIEEVIEEYNDVTSLRVGV